MRFICFNNYNADALNIGVKTRIRNPLHRRFPQAMQITIGVCGEAPLAVKLTLIPFTYPAVTIDIGITIR